MIPTVVNQVAHLLFYNYIKVCAWFLMLNRCRNRDKSKISCPVIKFKAYQQAQVMVAHWSHIRNCDGNNFFQKHLWYCSGQLDTNHCFDITSPHWVPLTMSEGDAIQNGVVQEIYQQFVHKDKFKSDENSKKHPHVFSRNCQNLGLEQIHNEISLTLNSNNGMKSHTTWHPCLLVLISANN